MKEKLKMYFDVNATNLQDSGLSLRLHEVPSECPRCHRSVHAKEKHYAYLAELNTVQVLFRCTNQLCQELFIGTYYSINNNEGGKKNFRLSHTDPVSLQEVEFSDVIANVSPTFVEIYNQSIAAETYELDQIVGIGLRKALEFLVKDFAISLHEGEEDNIRRKQLGNCISEYLNDANVKECAKRAAWLGNDEAHYTRKWEDKDIEDLKLLIKLTCNWIENVILTNKYVKEMEHNQ